MSAGQAPPPPNRPAGIVTRLLAAAIDLGIVALMMGGLFVGAAGLRFLWSPISFSWPTPSSPLPTLIGTLLAIGYLAVGWATSGRTYGAAVFGLRVLSSGRRPLGWTRAGLRAALCVVFPIGLLWAIVSRDRSSVQDVVVRSVVVYDWHQGGGVRATAPARPDTPARRWRPSVGHLVHRPSYR